MTIVYAIHSALVAAFHTFVLRDATQKARSPRLGATPKTLRPSGTLDFWPPRLYGFVFLGKPLPMPTPQPARQTLPHRKRSKPRGFVPSTRARVPTALLALRCVRTIQTHVIAPCFLQRADGRLKPCLKAHALNHVVIRDCVQQVSQLADLGCDGQIFNPHQRAKIRNHFRLRGGSRNSSRRAHNR